MTANSAKNDFEGVLSYVTKYNDPITVVDDDENAVVVLSLQAYQDYNRSIEDTLYLQSIPGMMESIKQNAEASLSDFIPVTKLEQIWEDE
jgi:PHD/YefM family antitoxin component YafN of YafNO toxin-antitoxin module